MSLTLTDKEQAFVAFHLACRLEDYEKTLKRNKVTAEGWNQFYALEKLIYTKFIPESWSGPRPSYWEDPNVKAIIEE